MRYLSFNSENMCCSPQSCTSFKLAKLLLAGWLLSIGALFFCEPCVADGPSLPIVPKPMEWVLGPATASLGTIAEIKVPAGYRFTDAIGARAFLERAKSSVPKNLIGLLAPNSGGQWIVFEFAGIGYVKEDAKDKLDAAAILTAVAAGIERQNQESGSHASVLSGHVDWEMQPAYDAGNHILEWAIIGGSQPENMVNHTLRLLGRHGVLSAATAGPHRDAADLSAMKSLLKDVSFKPGQSYADYRDGDKIAALGLGELVTADSSLTRGADASATAEGGDESGGSMFWIMLVAVGCGATVGVVLFVKKLRRVRAPSETQFFRKLDIFIEEIPDAASNPRKANSEPAISGRGARSPGSKPGTNGFKPVAAGAKAGLSAARLASKKAITGKPLNNRNGDRRKKIFNYHKFYTDMVLQGPAPAIGVESNAGHAFDQNRPEPMMPDQGLVMNANSELISNQKNLIEEQKRLIEEQSRFIQEKSKLIAEKNQLLERQSELIDNNLV